MIVPHTAESKSPPQADVAALLAKVRCLLVLPPCGWPLRRLIALGVLSLDYPRGGGGPVFILRGHARGGDG